MIIDNIMLVTLKKKFYLYHFVHWPAIIKPEVASEFTRKKKFHDIDKLWHRQGKYTTLRILVLFTHTVWFCTGAYIIIRKATIWLMGYEKLQEGKSRARKRIMHHSPICENRKDRVADITQLVMMGQLLIS